MNKKRIIDGAIVFIIALIILLYVNPMLASSMGIVGVAISEILFAMIAIGAVIMRRDSIADRLSLRFPTIKSFFGTVVLMLGANSFQNAITFIFTGLTDYSSNTDITFLEHFYANSSPFTALIVVALIPAVCEEILFRGYLLSSFKTKKNENLAVVITAFLFAAVHLDIYKFLPLLVMGLAYGYVAARTRSILLPAIFHFLNNSLAIISFYTMKNTNEELMSVDLSTKGYICYGLAAIGVGLVLVYFGTRMLSGKPRKKLHTIITLITSGVIVTAGIAMLMLDLIFVPYDGIYTEQLRKDTVYKETFVLESDALASVEASIMSSRSLECSVIITDSKGNIIYDHSDRTDQMLSLSPDEYTVTYSFDVDDDTTVANNVKATVRVTCISTEAGAGPHR